MLTRSRAESGLAIIIIGVGTFRRFGSVLEWPTVGRVALAAGVVAVIGVGVQVQGALLLGKVALLGVLYLAVLCVSGEVTARDFRSPLASARQPSA